VPQIKSLDKKMQRLETAMSDAGDNPSMRCAMSGLVAPKVNVFERMSSFHSIPASPSPTLSSQAASLASTPCSYQARTEPFDFADLGSQRAVWTVPQKAKPHPLVDAWVPPAWSASQAEREQYPVRVEIPARVVDTVDTLAESSPHTVVGLRPVNLHATCIRQQQTANAFPPEDIAAISDARTDEEIINLLAECAGQDSAPTAEGTPIVRIPSAAEVEEEAEDANLMAALAGCSHLGETDIAATADADARPASLNAGTVGGHFWEFAIFADLADDSSG
jgi:hypothetical protein